MRRHGWLGDLLLLMAPLPTWSDAAKTARASAAALQNCEALDLTAEERQDLIKAHQ